MQVFKKARVFHEVNIKGRQNIFVVGGLISAGVFLLILGIILFEINVVNFSNELILRFDFFQGITMVGGVEKVYQIFFLVGLIEFINISLAWFFLRRQIFLSYLFAATSLFFASLIFSTLLVIITVN
ncbi:MAG TPA: hypothetical protein VJK04_01095 [Candidatus Paceibacterota bacterium]